MSACVECVVAGTREGNINSLNLFSRTCFSNAYFTPIRLKDTAPTQGHQLSEARPGVRSHVGVASSGLQARPSLLGVPRLHMWARRQLKDISPCVDSGATSAHCKCKHQLKDISPCVDSGTTSAHVPRTCFCRAHAHSSPTHCPRSCHPPPPSLLELSRGKAETAFPL